VVRAASVKALVAPADFLEEKQTPATPRAFGASGFLRESRYRRRCERASA